MFNISVFLIAILSIWVIALVIQIIELSALIRGKNSSGITNTDNKVNGLLMILSLVAGIPLLIFATMKYSKFLLPVAASAHGVKIDTLFNTTLIIIISVFFITQILLFFFAYRYRFNKNKKAFFFPASHKLEIIWTVIPTIVLVTLVVYGLTLWNNITAPAPNDALVIELYGKQFDWTVRYAGQDNRLGKSNFKLIGGLNPLGIDTTDKYGSDDVITQEMHLPVNTPILLVMHSRDVIHSAYLPHFRVQMNCVPGMTTQFAFTPTVTTEQMRRITKNDKFDYVLLCNKICGTAHFNMNMKVVCETKEQYNAWLKNQKTFAASNAK